MSSAADHMDSFASSPLAGEESSTSALVADNPVNATTDPRALRRSFDVGQQQHFSLQAAWPHNCSTLFLHIYPNIHNKTAISPANPHHPASRLAYDGF